MCSPILFISSILYKKQKTNGYFLVMLMKLQQNHKYYQYYSY
jgi:hypothetical protein